MLHKENKGQVFFVFNVILRNILKMHKLSQLFYCLFGVFSKTDHLSLGKVFTFKIWLKFNEKYQHLMNSVAMKKETFAILTNNLQSVDNIEIFFFET